MAQATAEAAAAVCRRQKIGLFQLEAAAAAAAGPELIQQLLLLLLSRQTVETFMESCVCCLCYEKCFMANKCKVLPWTWSGLWAELCVM